MGFSPRGNQAEAILVGLSLPVSATARDPIGRLAMPKGQVSHRLSKKCL